jgi:hypothetical protein
MMSARDDPKISVHRANGSALHTSLLCGYPPHACPLLWRSGLHWFVLVAEEERNHEGDGVGACHNDRPSRRKNMPTTTPPAAGPSPCPIDGRRAPRARWPQATVREEHLGQIRTVGGVEEGASCPHDEDAAPTCHSSMDPVRRALRLQSSSRQLAPAR